MKNIISRCADAQDLAQKHPETFTAPTERDLNRIRVGQNLKISVDSVERFWIQAEEVMHNKIVGRINNDLVCVQDLRINDIVLIEKRNIYAIQ